MDQVIVIAWGFYPFSFMPSFILFLFLFSFFSFLFFLFFFFFLFFLKIICRNEILFARQHTSIVKIFQSPDDPINYRVITAHPLGMLQDPSSLFSRQYNQQKNYGNTWQGQPFTNPTWQSQQYPTAP
jgi:hypothetical protein